MKDEPEKFQEERLLAKGFRKPFFPENAQPRRWDGNEVLGGLGDWIQPPGSIPARIPGTP